MDQTPSEAAAWAHAPWTVRPAALLDVNAVARLLRVSAVAIDIDGDGAPDGPADPAAAEAAMRMVLSHVALEDGEVWVAERLEEPSGRREVVAASVWLPGHTDEHLTHLDGLLRRELHLSDVAQALGPVESLRPQLEATAVGVMTSIAQGNPALVLFAVVVSPRFSGADMVAIARDVVAPVRRQRAGQELLAVAIDDERARLLMATGFAEADRILLGDLHLVWLGRALPPPAL